MLTETKILPLLGGIVFASLKYSSACYLHSYMLTDPLNFLFISLTTLFMLLQWRTAFFLVALLGLFNKEIFAVMIICYLFFSLLERKMSRSLLLCAFLVILIYLLFRTFFPVPVNSFSLRNAFWGVPRWQSLGALYLLTFGILTFSALSRMWLSRFSLSLAPAAVLGILALFFACDHARIITYTAFPWVLFSVLGVKPRSRKMLLYTVMPVAVYFLFWWIIPRAQLKLATLLCLQLGVFILLEPFFLYEYFKDFPQCRKMVGRLKGLVALGPSK